MVVVVFDLRSTDARYARAQWDASARGAWRAAWPYRKVTDQGVATAMFVQSVCRALGRGLHSSTIHLNLSRFGR